MDNLSILSWNIRGACNFTARKNLQLLVSKHKPSLLCLQETKSVKWLDAIKDSIWSLRNHEWLKSPSDGLLGGIALLWDKSIFS